jgi:hypothetical protein
MTHVVGGGDVSPFNAIFPGQSIALSTGEILTIGPLSAYAITHEVPALIGRLMTKVAPIRAAIADRESFAEHLPEILAAASTELTALICHVTGLDPSRLSAPPPQGIRGDELLDVILLFLQENAGFFDRLGRLRDFARKELAPSGPGSSSP